MRHKRIKEAVCVAIILSCGCCSSVAQTEKSEVNSEPITAILGAFEREITLLEDQVTERQEQRIEGVKFVDGKLNGKRVVIAWTGIGTVNAAMTTTLLIEHFRPSEVIFTGIAGGVNLKLAPGDIVIAEKAAHHDTGVVWPEGLVYKGMKNPLDGRQNPVFFEADERLLKLAQRAAKQVKFRPIETNAGERAPHVVTGVVVTGDVFVASAEKCAELRERLGADAVEMEGAAVAQLCYQRRIGCLVIRSISDNADAGAVLDKQMFYIMAAKNSSSLVAETAGLLGVANEPPAKPQAK